MEKENIFTLTTPEGEEVDFEYLDTIEYENEIFSIINALVFIKDKTNSITVNTRLGITPKIKPLGNIASNI